jgi:peptidoglycan-N-acetylglucosamine deacetylase
MLAFATALTAALAAAGYQTMAPTGQWFGRAFCRAPQPSRQVALTFDDGPNDPYTLELLDVLSRHQVRATFFWIGRYVRQNPLLAAEVAKSGHVIGNHTFTHPLLTLQPASEIRDEIARCREAIQDAVGEHSNLFRPPWGGRRPGTFGMVRALGLEPVMWNVTGYDWKAPSADFIERKLEPKIRGGEVILLHDGGHKAFGTDRSHTVAAVDRIIARYKGQYEFVTIPEMMRASKLG